MFEIAKYLTPRSFLRLYCVSKDFHKAINGHLTHALTRSAEYQAPDSAKIYKFKMYSPLCLLDPAGRPHPSKPNEVRLVPGLKWFQMVVHREKCIRDILAMLARQGHRCPQDMPLSLKKMWLVMDVSTSAGRVQLMHSP